MKRISLAGAVGGALMLASGVAAAQLTLYKQPNFGGGEYTLNDSSRDLKGTDMYDQAASAVVRSGRWEVCSQPDFKGDCMVLEPGRHARLDAKVFHRIESVREIQPVAKQEPALRRDRYADNRYDPRSDNRQDNRYESRYENRYDAIVEAYTLPGFRGFSMKFDRDTDELNAQLRDEGINSLVVREGQWQLCTEPGFNGYCRTFGPGRYPRLGQLRDLPAGSLRRVG
jgi:hypothetical protein